MKLPGARETYLRFLASICLSWSFVYMGCVELYWVTKTLKRLMLNVHVGRI